MGEKKILFYSRTPTDKCKMNDEIRKSQSGNHHSNNQFIQL